MSRYKDNMTHKKNDNLSTDDIVLDTMVEQQIARHMTDLLNDSAQRLMPHQEQRLTLAHDAAVRYLAEKQAQLQYSNTHTSQGNVVRWFGDHFGQQHRMTSAALVILVMLVTFFAVQQFEVSNNLENSDAFLLASDLPPEAYADKGFDAWIDTN
jgi:hypothetical protein